MIADRQTRAHRHTHTDRQTTDTLVTIYTPLPYRGLSNYVCLVVVRNSSDNSSQPHHTFVGPTLVLAAVVHSPSYVGLLEVAWIRHSDTVKSTRLGGRR